MSKIAYFGTPYVARDTLHALIEAGFVPDVVITSPAKPKGRGLALTPSDTELFAREHAIPVLTPAVLDEAAIAEIQSYGCEIGIAVAYGKIIPQSLIDAFPKGIVNVHYSLLPKYRGASPVESALRNGESVTGVTVQQMQFALDAGDMLAQQELPVDATDTTRSLRPRLIALGADLLIRSLPEILKGSLAATPQNAACATRAPKIKKGEGQLSLSADALHNWNTYRALVESPGTYFYAQKEGKKLRVKITEASYQNGVFIVIKIIPEGKREQDFSYLTLHNWNPL